MHACKYLPLAVMLAIAGCGTTPEQDAQANATGEDPLVCRNVLPTGSHLPKRVCYRQSEIDASHDPALRKLFDQMQEHGPGAGGRSAGGTGSN